MEKKNIKFEDNGNSIAMRYELLPSDQLDDAALEKMKAGQLEMAAPIQYGEEEGRRMLYAYIPASVQLSTFLKRQLGKGEVLTILRNLVVGMDIGKNNIPVAYIIKDMDYIYIEEQTLRLFTFIVPIKGQTVEVTDVPDFMREVVSRMKFRDEDKDNYVARLLTNINSDRFSLNELNVLVNEMLLDLGDAQLAGVPQGGPAKVDRVGVMRNRAGTMPPQQQMFNPQTGQPMQPQMGQQQFNPMTGQPMQQQMPQQQMQPQMGQQQFNPMTGQPMQQQMQQQPMQQAPKPQEPEKKFDPMTGKPIGGPAPQGPTAGPVPTPAPQQAPQGPVAPQQAPIQQPQMQQAPKPQEPEKKFDPMTGKPIGGPAPQGPTPTPAPQQAPQGPVVPEAPKPQEAEKKFDPMTGKPINAPEPPKAPQGPAPQGPTAGPAPTPGPQAPQQPKEPEKKFDPMTGKPLGGPAPQGPTPTPAPQQAPQGPVAPQAPQQPQMQQPESPKAPQGPTAGPVPTPGPQAPQGPVQPQAPQQPGPQKGADDMFSIDDLMKMEDPEKSEAPAPEAPAEPAKPHFVREKTGEKIFIDKEEFKIGKSKVHSDYSIENNSAISRVHVIVIKRDEDCFLKDNDSTNGTYVDGDRLEPGREVQLKENMEIKFGDEDFVFHEK
ncbi:MAG: FHA domain-containing protein [Eubacterium sp.]|nr:FHA domain-containing protein [Eubacterium sp.]